MAWSIDDCDIILWCLKSPEGDIDGNATLALGLEFVKDPGILEGALAEFGGFLIVGSILSSQQ